MTVTGQLPPDPVAKNTIYASKPSGWGKIYAYVYTGDGATAANNAAWPGVEMTAPSATDGCQQTDLYKYVVPDNLAKGAKVIFNDGGSQQYPGSRQPGLDYNGGIVKWDGSSAALAAVECETTIPVTSVSVSGDGVKDGKLSLKSGASVQLTATVKPDNATDRKVTWTSSDSSVANVMGTGVVTAGSKAGTATIKATAGGKSASVQVTVTGVPKQPMTVWYKPDSSWKTAKVHYQANGKWTGSAQRMTLYRNGWYRYTIPDTAGGQVRMAFTDGGSVWDNNGGQGKDYRVSGSVVSACPGRSPYSAPSFDESPMTVWYKPDSSWKTAKVNYQANGKWSGGAQQMEASCGGWYRYTIPDTAGGQVRMAFTDGGSVWDNNGGQGKDYRVSGDSVAVAGGQMITDVTPNCAATNK